ncbi:MAG: sn-glycerol-3-phosphate ABC transporter ATP-binding protein UgpC [Elusimicrobia bacterium]|nr:sn-glycerol-3-phosphate ABC transporter ATP-binding protein UgpC [Elusimicrobiota bacterium]
MASVTLKGIGKSYETATVLRGIDLDIAEREFMVLVGPSGCGKSTLLRMIAGLEETTEGLISIEGKPVNDLPPREREIAMVFQDYALYPHMSVADNMSFGLRLRGMAAAEIAKRVAEAAAILHLEPLLERMPRQLSGGQRQRVAIGRAIVRKPKVFLFDEPLSNLDAKLREEMRVEIAKLHQRIETTVVYVTHDQVEAMTLATRLAVMSGGRIQQVGPPAEVFSRPANMFVAGFIGSPTMNFIEGALTADGAFTSPVVSLKFAGNQFKPGAAVLGVRPDDIEAVPGGTPDSFEAELEVAELLGHRKNLYLKSAGARLLAVVEATFNGAPGSKVHLKFRQERVHLFDKASGERIAR